MNSWERVISGLPWGKHKAKACCWKEVGIFKEARRPQWNKGRGGLDWVGGRGQQSEREGSFILGTETSLLQQDGWKGGGDPGPCPSPITMLLWDLFTPISRPQLLRAEAGKTSLEPIHPTQFSDCSRCLSKAKGSSLTWAMQGAQPKIRSQTVADKSPASLGLKHGSRTSKYE